MSRRAAWIAGLFCLIALGFAAWYLGRGSGPAVTPAGPAAVLRPSQVRGIAVDCAGESLAIEQHERTWAFRSRGGARWPVAEERVRAALRLLTEAIGAEASSPSEEPDASWVTLTLAHEGGPTTVRLSPLRAGGAVVARVESPGANPAQVQVQRALREIFEPAALRTWRAAVALPDAALGVSRIELESAVGRVTLRQSGSSWNVLQPVSAPADAERVRALLSVLAGVPAASFEDALSPDSPEVGIDRPIASITIERDDRSLEGSQAATRVVISELRIGRFADLASTSSFAVASARVRSAGGVEQPLWGPVVITVPTAELNRITAAPQEYLSRRTLPWPASEARVVSLAPIGGADQPRAFSRGPSGWRSGDAPAHPEDEAGLNALLALLSETRAVAVLPDTEAAGVQWTWTVTQRGIAQASLGAVRLGRTAGGAQPPVIVTDFNGTVRTYEFNSDLARWLGW